MIVPIVKSFGLDLFDAIGEMHLTDADASHIAAQIANGATLRIEAMVTRDQDTSELVKFQLHSVALVFDGAVQSDAVLAAATVTASHGLSRS